MKAWIFILFALIAVPAFAADDFGARFADEAPNALAAPEDELTAADLQNIEPAAGDEEDSAQAEIAEPAAASAPSAEKPASNGPITVGPSAAGPIVRIENSVKP